MFQKEQKEQKEQKDKIGPLSRFVAAAKQTTEKLLLDAGFPKEPNKEITIQNIKQIATENIEILRGDITTFTVDARVMTTAPNPEIGSETSRYQLKAIFSALRRLNIYQAKISRTSNLPARYIIHIVESTWQQGTQQEIASLANNYRSCLTSATRKSLKVIAFPDIICSMSQYPIAQAVYTAFKEVLEFLMDKPNKSRFKKVYFICQNEEIYQIYLDVQKILLIIISKNMDDGSNHQSRWLIIIAIRRTNKIF
ncbi:Appr-1-p processing enzyme family [Beggiatoa sp. PS]|nr:Appr-1-p processing enzyme family [Beggiatoa sp. PS]